MTRSALGCTLSLVLAAPSLGVAQTWTRQAPLPTAVPLRGIRMLSHREAWAIGAEGVLVHTTDAGRTWSRTTFSPRAGMSSVTFVDPSTGWAAGNEFFRTTDGGRSWQRIDFAHGSLGPVFFLDRRIGWTCDRYRFYRTSDGGSTWQAFPRVSGRGASSLFFFDTQAGWLVTPWGDIERTNDGGRTWTVVHQHPDLLSRIWFADRLEGWAVGGNTALHTADGGNTWQPRSFPSAERVGTAVFVPPTAPGSDPVSYAAGIGGCVVKSSDGWRTYSVVRPLGSGPDLRGIHFIDAQHGFAVGEYGVLIYTDDGGRTWNPRHSGGPGGFHRMDVNDAAHAWLAADLGNVVFTTDAGARWQRVPVAGFSRYGTIKSVDFHDDNLTGWATGVERAFGGNASRVSRSTDGGHTWELQFTSPPDVFFETVDAVDESTAVACGWNPWGYDLWVRTGDGGRSWQDITPSSPVGTVYDSDFVDGQVGFVAGGRIRKTTDGGRNWTELPLPDEVIEGISFADRDNGWAVGAYDYVIHTSDGGATWQRQAAGQFPHYRMLSVSAVSATEAWLVGDESRWPGRQLVARTTDGGATWTEESVVGPDVLPQAVAFLDAEYGWVAGGIATGWQYFDGGIWRRSDAPARALSLLHGRLFRGSSARLRVAGARSGDLSGIFFSPTGIRADPLLDLLPPVYSLVVLPVQPDGSAAFDLNLPSQLPLFGAHFQAVVFRPSTGALLTTNTTSTRIEP